MNIGIFGGTFNPIHLGHIQIINQLIKETSLDEVWLMVSPQNPLKGAEDRVNSEHRIAMAREVAGSIDGCEICTIEFELPRPSYTINTLSALQDRFPQHVFSLIVGGDNWENFHHWKDHDKILQNHHIFVYPRKESRLIIPPEFESNVTIIRAPLVIVSSSEIRQNISNLTFVKQNVPECVFNYIVNHKLYL